VTDSEGVSIYPLMYSEVLKLLNAFAEHDLYQS
jgi:hypothetical protein